MPAIIIEYSISRCAIKQLEPIKANLALLSSPSSTCIDTAVESPPFLAQYSNAPYQLDFAAVNHSSYRQSDDPAYLMIKRQFDKEPPRALILEGYDGAIADDYCPRADEQEVWRSEQDYAISLARAEGAGVAVVPGETSTADLYQSLLDLKNAGETDHSEEDILNFLILRMLPPKETCEEMLREFHRHAVQFVVSKLPEDNFATRFLKTELQDLKHWYNYFSGNDFESRAKGATEQPLFDGTRLQNIRALANRIRDENVISLVELHLNRHKHIMVVFGAGHFWDQKPVFDEMFRMRPEIFRSEGLADAAR